MKLSFECDLTWDDLQGDDKVRRQCLACDHPVYNLSGMSRQRAERLFAEHGVSPPCVHFVSVEGRIVHDGDPLSQLHSQRAGARKLVAAAIALQMGSMLIGNPGPAGFIPFAGLFLIGGGTTTGVPARQAEGERPNIRWERDDMQCVGVRDCHEQAQATIAYADAITAGEDPARAYLAYRELDRAHNYYVKSGGVPAGETGVVLEERLREAEDEVNRQFQQHRINYMNYITRKMWDGASKEVRTLQVLFPDRKSLWGEWALEHERKLKDDGVWVEPSEDAPPG